MSGESMPGTFRSPLVRAREKSESVRVTVPEGIAKLIGAVPGGTLVWSANLGEGLVTVFAEPPAAERKKSSKRR